MVVLLKSDNYEITANKESLKELTRHVSERLGEGIDEQARHYLRVNNSLYTGEIAKEIKVKPVGDGARVRFNSNQAKWIEFGTGPARRPVPIKPLREWAMKKLNLPEKQAQQVAVSLSKSITRHGIRAQPFIYPAIYHMKSTEKRL